MKVITLNQDLFDDACDRLANAIADEYAPDVIIGIESGGAVVAQQMFDKLLGHFPQLQYFNVSAYRNSSKTKRKYKVSDFLCVLPDILLNSLRLLEHYVLSVTMYANVSQPRNVEINTALKGYLERLSEGCVFLVDDAIDSGATMNEVIGVLKKINPALDYRTTALVLTQKTSHFVPDLSLYNNVLIRFPWSNDFKR